MKKNLPKRIAMIGLPVLRNPFNEVFERYAEETGYWRCVLSAEDALAGLKFVSRLAFDGAIIRVTTPAMARLAGRLPFPVVNISSWLEKPGVPTCRRDDEAMGRLCAAHLLGKGLRRFGCVVQPGGWFIRARRNGFRKAIEAAGYPVSLFRAQTINPIGGNDRRRFLAWVRTLGVPAGLLLIEDCDAPVLLDLCRQTGLRVPEDIAVMASVGHPEVLERCVQPLSHCVEDPVALAKAASDYLQRLIAAKNTEPHVITVPPLGVVPLASTDMVAVDDREVARAVEYIRARARQTINVSDVVAHTGMVRRTLERRFHSSMGCSLLHFLQQERLAAIRQCLGAVPPLPLEQVAQQCGFPGRKALNRMFTRETGLTPGAWRKRETGLRQGSRRGASLPDMSQNDPVLS